MLKNVLAPRYRIPEITRPPRAPTSEDESAYVGFYTFVVALIMLNGGTLPEAKLERYLKRANAEMNLAIGRAERTAEVLQRMQKDGYVVKVVETSGGGEMVDYVVGPRGKAEIGPNGVAGMAAAVWGDVSEDLERRLERSLGMDARSGATAQAADGRNPNG